MRIEQLEYLAAIARLGSFRRAAEELHISQPALSGRCAAWSANWAWTSWSGGGTGPG